MNWDTITQHISEAVNKPFLLDSHTSVGGGCINSAYRLAGSGQQYFVKLNSANQIDMFIAESEGLMEMRKADAVHVPEPVCYGTTEGQSFLVMENLELGGGGSAAMEQLGHELADMHRYTQDKFGWHRDNTIGSTPQINTKEIDWIAFWREHRLGFQLQLAGHRGAGRSLLQKGERLMTELAAFFTDYEPEASLLHGDLWSGNYGVSTDGRPVIFDPAFYPASLP